MDRRVFLAAGLLLAAFVAGQGFAQPAPPGHTIIGTVRDAGGAEVTGAEVTVTNQRTGESASGVTDHLGHYSVNLACQSGDRVRAEARAPHLYGAREVVVDTVATPLTECDIVMERTGIGLPVILGIVGGLAFLVLLAAYYVYARRAGGAEGREGDRTRRRRR